MHFGILYIYLQIYIKNMRSVNIDLVGITVYIVLQYKSMKANKDILCHLSLKKEKNPFPPSPFTLKDLLL